MPTAPAASLRWVLLATLLLQGLLQSIFFPLSALVSREPLVHIDAPYHAYQMEVARQLCAERELQGWDPYFGAGQPAGVVGNASAKLQAGLACADGRPTAVWPLYKASSFSLGVIAPAALVVACMLLGLSLRSTVFVAVLAVLMWWTGGLRWYHAAGLVSYVAMAYLVIPFTIAAAQLAMLPRTGVALGLGLLAALGFWLHPLFPVAAVLLGLPLLLARWPELRRPVWGVMALVGVAALMLALNAAWVLPTVGEKTGISNGLQYQAGVQVGLPFWEMLGRAGTAGGGTRLALALAIGAVLLLVLPRVAHRRVLVGLMLGAFALMTWASVGGLVSGIARLQPNRFSMLAWLVLVLPAAVGLDAALAQWRDASRARRWVLGLMLGGAAVVVAFFVRETVREFALPAGHARYGVAPPEVKGDGAILRSLTTFLQEQTDRSGRVLFENSLARIHDGAHIAGLLALRGDRELIGGAYPGVDVANAWDDVAFGQPLASFSPTALAERLDAYNVRWILCHRDTCRQAMSRLPGVAKVADLGPVTAFKRAAVPGWVAEGVARVQARCHNRLELDGVQGDRVVLRYHWVPGLRSLEGGEVKPVDLVPGARPFVAIDHPPSRVTLRRGTGDGLPCERRAAPAL